ncbi:MAG: DUF305 domain-containing protein, partial [Vicinamibacterales bacterium]
MVRGFLVFILISFAGAACKSSGVDSRPQAAQQPPPTLIQPGAPGQSSKPIDAAQATDLSKVQYTQADVKFMQGMIGHHAQAIEMVALLEERTNWEDVRKLGLRIEVSQEDEIKMMQTWLSVRGQTLPDPHAHHTGGALMPGMLTMEEMARLGAAKGA